MLCVCSFQHRVTPVKDGFRQLHRTFRNAGPIGAVVVEGIASAYVEEKSVIVVFRLPAREQRAIFVRLLAEMQGG